MSLSFSWSLPWFESRNWRIKCSITRVRCLGWSCLCFKIRWIPIGSAENRIGFICCWLGQWRSWVRWRHFSYCQFSGRPLIGNLNHCRVDHIEGYLVGHHYFIRIWKIFRLSFGLSGQDSGCWGECNVGPRRWPLKCFYQWPSSILANLFLIMSSYIFISSSW